MDIGVQAFEIGLGRNIGMDDIYGHIVASSGNAIDERYLYVARHNGWWRGLLLTARNIKAFTRMQRDGGHITLSPENLGESELAHFNYFIINEANQRGLFQHYHGAASLHGFGFLLKQKYSTLKNQRISTACLAAGEDPANAPSSITRQFAGFLSYEIVLRRSTFETLIRELRQIRQVTVQFKEYTPGTRLFRPLALKAHALRHKLTFRDQYNGALRDDLIALARSDDLKDLRGIGITDGDLERRFRLLNEPETLGRFDFNEIVLNTAFDSNDIANSLGAAPMIAKLHEIAEEDAWCMGRV